MEYLQLTMDEFLQEEQGIKNELADMKTNLGKIRGNFSVIGWHLNKIKASEAYKLKGYKTISEYAKAEYAMSGSDVSRYINTYLKCSIPGDTPELQEKYKDFEFFQLREMLNLSEEDEAIVRPELSRQDIRDLNEFNEANKNNPDALLNWNRSREDNLENAVQVFFWERKDSLNALYQSEAYQNNDIAGMVGIIRNGQRKSFKSKDRTVFMVLYEKEIFIKGTSGESEDITWEKFFEITKRLFDGSAAGDHTWENYFKPGQKESTEEPETAQTQQEEQNPGQENIINHLEYLPQGIPIEEQYKALYEIMTPATLAPLNNGETGFLAAMIYENLGKSSIKSEKLNYRATDDGMLFNPDTEKILVGWTALAEDLIKIFGKRKPVRMASIIDQEDTEPDEKWTEAEAVKRFAEEYPRKLKEIMKICRQYDSNGERAKAIQKYFVPYGCCGGSSGGLTWTFANFTSGIEIKNNTEKQKVEMKYGRFVTEILNLYDPFSPEFTEDEIAPAQQERVDDATETKEAHRQQDKEESTESMPRKPEEWPEDLSDIPVPSITVVKDFLWDAERDLKEYLEVEGLPQKVLLKQQLWTAGLRIIKNLLEDISEESLWEEQN